LCRSGTSVSGRLAVAERSVWVFVVIAGTPVE
jgi:hypothetical protein